MGTHFRSIWALDPTWTPTLPSGIKNDDLGPKNEQKMSKMTPGFSKFDHKCVKEPSQDKQKYRTKTSSQDTPDFKKRAVRMLSHTYPELLSHLLFLSRPGGMRAALGITLKKMFSFFVICVSKMVKQKLRLRGWDLSGEIHAEILRSFPPGSCKTVGWRPNWCQKGVILGPLGFPAQLAHPKQ